MKLISDFFVQLLSTVGIVALFGLLIALLRRSFCAVFKTHGSRILLATGIVGTPIHELSHALMCIIFGHKITAIKLYDPKAKDGSLGYVSHKFDKRNLYHKIGNLFIGTAPVVIGGGIIIALMFFLIPDAFHTVIGEATELAAADITAIPLGEYFSYISASLSAIFSDDTLTSWQGILFILLAIMIATHMEMSRADIKNSLSGFIFLALLLLVLDGAIYLLFPEFLSVITSATVSFGLMLTAFLSISLVFLLAILILGIVIKGLISIFKK